MANDVPTGAWWIKGANKLSSRMPHKHAANSAPARPAEALQHLVPSLKDAVAQQDALAQAEAEKIAFRRAMGAARDVEDVGDHHGGKLGAYLVHKENKVREQLHAELGPVAEGKNVFTGVSIWVNGRTTPPYHELRALVASLGGTAETWYTRDRVSHIVAENLPAGKLDELRRADANQPPAVTPQWVVDSAAAGRLLPIGRYLLAGLLPPGVRRIDTVPGGVETGAGAGVQTERGEAPWRGDDDDAGGCHDPIHDGGDCDPALRCDDGGDRDGGASQCNDGGDPPSDLSPPIPWEWEEEDDRDDGGRWGEGRAAKPLEPPPPPPLNTDVSLVEAHKVAATARAACALTKGPPRSSADNPECFLRDYFAASRLHFIGSWRLRNEALLTRLLASRAGPSRRPPPPGPGQPVRTILHVDLDCFFAAVAVRSHPSLQGVPLAVCHSAAEAGTGEISSCTYEARAMGVTAGMFMRDARRKCPSLVVMPYDFGAYATASDAVYRILVAALPDTRPMSVDEAFCDATAAVASAGGDPAVAALRIAGDLRRLIKEATGLTASVGIGPNMLLARMATHRAKPDGVHHVAMADALSFLDTAPVAHLPKCGDVLAAQLAAPPLACTTVGQLRAVSREALIRAVPPGAVSRLMDQARGVDHQPVEPPAPALSVGAQCNYGVRPRDANQAHHLATGLAAEVASRLAVVGKAAKSMTMTVLVRPPDAPVPTKHLGHGHVEQFTAPAPLAGPTWTATALASAARAALESLLAPRVGRRVLPAVDIRGMGLHASRLVPAVSPGVGVAHRPSVPVPPAPPRPPPGPGIPLPPRESLDESVLAELPLAIRAEVLAQYRRDGVAPRRKAPTTAPPAAKAKKAKRQAVASGPPMAQHRHDPFDHGRLVVPPVGRLDADILRAGVLPAAMADEIRAAIAAQEGSTGRGSGGGAAAVPVALPAVALDALPPSPPDPVCPTSFAAFRALVDARLPPGSTQDESRALESDLATCVAGRVRAHDLEAAHGLVTACSRLVEWRPPGMCPRPDVLLAAAQAAMHDIYGPARSLKI